MDICLSKFQLSIERTEERESRTKPHVFIKCLKIPSMKNKIESSNFMIGKLSVGPIRLFLIQYIERQNCTGA